MTDNHNNNNASSGILTKDNDQEIASTSKLNSYGYTFTVDINNRACPFVLPLKNRTKRLDTSELLQSLRNYLDKDRIKDLEVQIENPKNSWTISIYFESSKTDCDFCIDTLGLVPGVSNLQSTTPDKTTSFVSLDPNSLSVLEDLPQSLRDVLRKGRSYPDIHHQTGDGASVHFQTLRYHTHVAVIGSFRLITKKNLKSIVHDCSLVDKFKANTKASCVIYGVHRPESGSKRVTKGKSISAHLDISKDPSFGIEKGHTRSEESEQKALNIREILHEIDDDDSDSSICIEFDKDLIGQDIIIRLQFVFSFELPSDIADQNLHLASHFHFSNNQLLYKVKQKLHMADSKRSTHAADLVKIHKENQGQQRTNIGGIVGFPSSGKTSFVNEITQATKNSHVTIQDTPYLEKYEFDNVRFAPDDRSRTFSFIDTKGHYFKPTEGKHIEYLRRLIRGLPAGTEFSNLDDNTPNCPENSLTHIVLIINARSLYKPASYWASWLYHGGQKEEVVQGFVQLYDLALQLLAEEVYGKKVEEARKRIAVLITHLDLIPERERSNFENVIRDRFKAAGVPENFIVFAMKECSWKESDVVEHEEKVSGWVRAAENLGMDYYQYIRVQLKEGFNALHIPASKCMNSNRTPKCEHRYTKRTTDNYSHLLSAILNVG